MHRRGLLRGALATVAGLVAGTWLKPGHGRQALTEAHRASDGQGLSGRNPPVVIVNPGGRMENCTVFNCRVVKTREMAPIYGPRKPEGVVKDVTSFPNSTGQLWPTDQWDSGPRYIYFSKIDGEGVRTKEVHPGVFMDFSVKTGKPVGIELL